jgi:signal transduction histidine kinase
MRTRDQLARFAGSWHSDLALAAGLSVVLLAWGAAQGYLHGLNNFFEYGCGLGLFGCMVARRRFPKLAALAAAGLLLLTTVGYLGNLPVDPDLVPIFLVGYSLGSDDDQFWSLVVMIVLLFSMQAANDLTVFNPIVPVSVLGSWGLGRVVGSRRRLAEQLAARGAELAAERELFAAEAIRYERARIARELHDIVAHCLSVMVIQASAGQRLTGQDPALAADAFDAIAESVRQAESEIGRLVELLEHEASRPVIDGIRLVDELVARATAAGLMVRCRFTGAADGVSAQAAEAMYRVVQESLTNALKHAPGAPVDVIMAGTGGELEVSVANGTPTVPASGLERAGAGRGLTGMRERVQACGGELTAGPAEAGGWRVRARFPAAAQSGQAPRRP